MLRNISFITINTGIFLLYLIRNLTSKQSEMKRSLFLLLHFMVCSLVITAQKADFKAAEKFRGDNLTPKYGDLSVNASWIEESDIFWYSFKTS